MGTVYQVTTLLTSSGPGALSGLSVLAVASHRDNSSEGTRLPQLPTQLL